ncbi:unnamed protein product [Staurois parvus]|uniref:Uncharacterized protein n=1 Tax=Staurois parvus TaxID=386267 RepID=A0ABN9F1I9_9NEOB|nr:unnamed protein product [Staurois parvus]
MSQQVLCGAPLPGEVQSGREDPLHQDASQQTRDGPRGRRLGNVRRLFAETRPVPDAADIPRRRQDLPRPEQITDHQRHESRHLPGGLGALQVQEGGEVRRRRRESPITTPKRCRSRPATVRSVICVLSMFSV